MDAPDPVPSDPFFALLGAEVASEGEGSATVLLRIRPDFLNNNGVLHGGLLTTLIDWAGAAAAHISPGAFATTDLHTSYLSAASGAWIEARGRVLRRGRTAIFTETEIVDDRGRLVARGRATLVAIAPGPGA